MDGTRFREAAALARESPSRSGVTSGLVAEVVHSLRRNCFNRVSAELKNSFQRKYLGRSKEKSRRWRRTVDGVSVTAFIASTGKDQILEIFCQVCGDRR
ncbi:hypothetical protein [Streptomyces coeruleorubidus]|uniref:hypothetical protein n=1 Tax=Streptomyces coeruleorubidus TaxID=116188 RepID=UPI0037957A89